MSSPQQQPSSKAPPAEPAKAPAEVKPAASKEEKPAQPAPGAKAEALPEDALADMPEKKEKGTTGQKKEVKQIMTQMQGYE